MRTIIFLLAAAAAPPAFAQTTAGDAVGGLVLIAFAIGFYFLPAMVAGARNHRNTGAILVLNVLLGWTLLGWVAALVWACTNSAAPQADPATSASPAGLPVAPRTKQCPRCAETVKAAATVCRFCGHEFELPAPPQARPLMVPVEDGRAHTYRGQRIETVRNGRFNAYRVAGNDFDTLDEARRAIDTRLD